MAMQISNTKVVFEGQGSGQLIWYPMAERTEILDHADNFKMSYKQNPFGLLDPQKIEASQNSVEMSSQLIFTQVYFAIKMSVSTVLAVC